jgi:O-antigen/teichoic acid export membrane protein
VIKTFSSSLLASIAILAMTAVSGIISARVLGPSGRGVMSAVILWPMVMAGVGSLGLLEATSYFCANGRFDRGVVLGSAMVLFAVLTIVLVAIGVPVMGAVLQGYGPDAIWLGRLALVCIPTTLFATGFGVAVLGSGRIATFNVLRGVQAAGMAIGVLALLIAGTRSVTAFVGVAILAHLVNCAVAGSTALAAIGPPRLPQASILREMLAYGLRSHVGYIASTLNVQLDQMLLSILLAPAALGLYSVALSLAGLVLIVPSAMVVSTFPEMASDRSTDKLDLLGRALRTTTVLGGLIVVPLLATGPLVIDLLFGESYLGAAPILQILLLAAVPLALTTVLSAGVRAMNQPMLASYAEMFSLGATAALLPVLLPRFGAIGAAITSLVAYSVSAGYLVTAVRRQFGHGASALILPRRSDWAWVVAQWQATAALARRL